MADHRNTDAKARSDAPRQQSVGIAERTALAVSRDIVRHLDPDVLDSLRQAALCAERKAGTQAVKTAIANGVRREDLADFYIPEISRQLGDEWCSDQLGFANVTIGVSRLQSMLRDLGPDWSGDKTASPDAPSIMLLVPQEVYHTLGAMVLSGQLRRKGLSVRMMIGARIEEVVDRISQTHYDAIFITASCGETLETLRRIVDVIRTSTDQTPPIVIGGSILEVETEDNVTALTGADYATSKPDRALKLCGLTKTSHSGAPSMRRT